MTFPLEIPRDLFNDANLLKCYGQVFINLETAQAPDAELIHDGKPFFIVRELGDGSTWVANVKLKVRGTAYHVFRPSNSRYPWPLYLRDQDGDEVEIFADDGSFTEEMLKFIGSARAAK